MNSAKIISVIETKHERNDGGIIREATRYWSADGKLLAEVDPHSRVVNLAELDRLVDLVVDASNEPRPSETTLKGYLRMVIGDHLTGGR